MLKTICLDIYYKRWANGSYAYENLRLTSSCDVDNLLFELFDVQDTQT